MKQTDSAGGIVFNKKGEVLLVYNSKTDSWTYPKGHVESKDILECAKREIYEESGIKDLDLIKELGNYQRTGRGRHELKTIHMYLFKTREMELKPIDKENPEARWVKKDKVTDLLTYEKDKEFFLSVVGEI